MKKPPRAPVYIEGYPAFKSMLSNIDTPEEFLAARWALDQLPALMTEQPRPWNIITYEELFLNQMKSLSRIFETYGFAVDLAVAVKRAKRPSSATYRKRISGVAGWQKQLSDEQTARILQTIEGFGIMVYGRDIEPDHNLLHSDMLPQQIRDAGK